MTGYKWKTTFIEPIQRAASHQPFTIDRDELTPTLKLRRKIITGHYSDIIEAMYAKA